MTSSSKTPKRGNIPNVQNDKGNAIMGNNSNPLADTQNDDAFMEKNSVPQDLPSEMEDQIIITKDMQAQKLSNITMATVLSTAENLTWRLLEKDDKMKEFLKDEYMGIKGYKEGKYIFRSYDTFNSGKVKSIPSLVNQFVFQIDNFSEDYKQFKKLYENYKFPDNMPKSQILKILNIWMTALSYDNITKSYNKYFISLYNIISDIPEISYENEMRKQFKGGPKSGKADPNILQKAYAKIVDFLDKKANDYSHFNIDLWK